MLVTNKEESSKTGVSLGKSMRVLTNVFSSDNFASNDYDLCIIELDEEGARNISIYFNYYQLMSKSCPDLDSMAFKNKIPCRFYDGQDFINNSETPFPKEVIDSLDNDGWAVLPNDFKEPLENKMENNDYYMSLRLTDDGFWVVAEMLEESLTLTTTLINREVLSRIL